MRGHQLRRNVGERLPSGRNGKCKGPEVGTCWVGFRCKGGQCGWSGVSEGQMETKEVGKLQEYWGQGGRVDHRAMGSHRGRVS